MAHPWSPGALHVTAACLSPRVAPGAPGVSGTPHGFTAADAWLHAPQSASRLRARTWNCCSVPLGRLLQRNDVPVIDAGAPGALSICTWYCTIGSPLASGAPQLRSRYLSPWTARGAPGADGSRSGCSAADHADDSERPAALIAVTRNW